MSEAVTLLVSGSLRFFLPAGRRQERIGCLPDGTSTLGHLVQSVGVPLTEVGGLVCAGRHVDPDQRPLPGRTVHILEVRRPQRTPTTPPRFLLDVHLGALARRMRLLGLDVVYRRDAGDDQLARQAVAESRMLLTRDRGLLRRRALRQHAAFVRGDDPDVQVRDVLDRFAPPQQPWTRCLACNGLVEPVAKADVEAVLQPGTRRCYHVFVRCPDCGAVYWRGAHGRRLQQIIDDARSAGRLADRTPRHLRDQPR